MDITKCTNKQLGGKRMKKMIKFSSLVLLLGGWFFITMPQIGYAASNDSYDAEATIGFYGEYPSDVPEGENSGNENEGEDIGNIQQNSPQLPQTGERSSLHLMGFGVLLSLVTGRILFRKNITYK